MKDIDTIGVADGEGQDMGEAQTEACVPVSELREKARKWTKKARQKTGGVRGTYLLCAEDLTELADKYDSNE